MAVSVGSPNWYAGKLVNDFNYTYTRLLVNSVFHNGKLVGGNRVIKNDKGDVIYDGNGYKSLLNAVKTEYKKLTKEL